MSSFLSILLAICLALPGLSMAVMPWLAPAGEVFAVTVPPAAVHDPRIRRLRAGYAAAMVALTVAVAPIGVLDPTNVALYVTLCMALPVVGFAGMLVCRARVQAIKVREGWRATGEKITSAVLPAAAPGPLPLAWDLLYLPIISATAALTVALYPSMPAQIPMHTGLDGVVNGWAEKSWGAAAFPVLMQLFMAAVMIACHAGVLVSKRGGAGARPVAGALAYGRFAQVQTASLLGMGLALTASMALIVLSEAQIIGVGEAGALVGVLTLVSTGVALALSVWTGQSGARLLGTPAARDEALSTDDDALWKGGVVYVSRDDPSVMVPKRFGVGWTLNWGNWRSWAVTVVFVALTALFVWLTMALVG
jgi:uncharacterized membrane protein